MPHRDTVIDGDRVEFLGDATGFFNLRSDQLADVLEVDVAGNELGEGVDDGNDRLAKVRISHSGCAPQRASARHVASLSRRC